MNPPYPSAHTDTHSRTRHPDTGELRELWTICQSPLTGDIRLSESALSSERTRKMSRYPYRDARTTSRSHAARIHRSPESRIFRPR